MSGFLTPPRFSPRDQESSTTIPSASRVVWSEENSIHLLSPSGSSPLAPISLNTEPTRSILKKSSISALTTLDASEREVTPEPSDFKQDSKYLNYPISQIISANPSLSDLIEAYNILAARLRSCFSKDVEPGSSWPLFQPVKQNADDLVSCIVRDLGRAYEDPLLGGEDENSMPAQSSSKASPQKKCGMSADQARNARDLCTTCQSVMKLLGIILSERTLMDLLTEEHMRDILTAIIAIPLCSQLPTINARKTYALSIWLIQTQRLPQDVLFPAKDRIAYALRRAVEGELGKEGKKGSASDGLKAIHELSVYQPETFIPAFAQIFSSILGNLTALSSNIRIQAAHALGGFVLGFIALPRKHFHTRIAAELASFIKTRPLAGSPSKSSGPESPSKNDAPIIRTLRTTLQNIEGSHIAQGPVWAMSVLSSFIVLLGPLLKTDKTTSRIISALLNLAIRFKKGPLRSLTCITWRCISWAYMQPTLPTHPDEDSDSEDDVPLSPETTKLQETMWRVTMSVVDMGAGTSTIAGLMGDENRCDDHFEKMFDVLRAMIPRTSGTYMEALMCIRQLIHPDESKLREWDVNRFLPRGLFDTNPGLLTTDSKDMQSLTSTVNPLFSSVPDVADITPLTTEEVPILLGELWQLWKECLDAFPRYCDRTALTELVDTWNTLIKTQLSLAEDDEGWQAVALNAVDALIEVLVDHDALWNGRVSSSSASSTSSSSPSKQAPKPVNAPLKLKVVRELWIQLRLVMNSEELLYRPAQRLMACLMSNENTLAYATSQSRTYWNTTCAHVLVDADVPVLKAFWGEKILDELPQWKWDWPADVRSDVWNKLVEVFTASEDANIESIMIFLGVPFTPTNAWDFENGDFEAWEGLLTLGLNKALDLGADPMSYFDSIAGSISDGFNPTCVSSHRIADLLMSHAEAHFSDARELPQAMLDFVNDTLHCTYPPHPKDITPSLWMIRSLTKLIEVCPKDILTACLSSVQEGAVKWIADEFRAIEQADYGDLQSLWETTAVRMFELPNDADTLKQFTPLVESIFAARENKDVSMESFDDFWSTLYLHKVSRDAWPDCVKYRFPETEESHVLDVSPSAEETQRSQPLQLETSVESSLSAVAEIVVPEQPLTPVSPSKSESLPSPPCTPTSEPVSLPPTPRKMCAEHGFPYAIPTGTPTSPTPKRGCGTPRNLTSPSTPSRKRKRTEEENKENASPSIFPSISPARVIFGAVASPSSRVEAKSPPRKRKSMVQEEEDTNEDEFSLKARKKHRVADHGLIPSPELDSSIRTAIHQPANVEEVDEEVQTSKALIPYATSDPFVFSFTARPEPEHTQPEQTFDDSPEEAQGFSLFGSPLKAEEQEEGDDTDSLPASPTPRRQVELPMTPSESPRKRAKVFVEPPALHDVYPDLFMRSPKKSKDGPRSVPRRQVSMPIKQTPKKEMQTPSRRSGRLLSATRRNSYKLREAGHPGYGTPKRGTTSVAGQLETPERSLESDDGPHMQRSVSMLHFAKKGEEEEEEEESVSGSNDSPVSPMKEMVLQRLRRSSSA